MLSPTAVNVQPGSRASAALDAARSLAAFAVFAGHARSVFFVEHAELAPTSPGPLTQAFYFVTGLGHQAVLVFFVLSGLFIAQAVRARHRAGTWSWLDYLVDRTSRLHIVLIPALLLTLGLDLAGAELMPALYDGTYPSNILAGPPSERLGPGTFLANAFYVQTIVAPTYGSNGPLWSLAYELWYYLLFPLALRVALAPGLRERLVCGALALGAAAFVGGPILLYFPVWLLGAVLTVLPPLPLPSRLAQLRPLLPWALGLPLVAAVAFARARPSLVSDYVLGVAVALWAWALLSTATSAAAARPAWRTLSAGFAAFSYTLYAVHLPLTVFVRAALGPALGDAPRLAPSVGAIGLLALVLVGGLAFSWLVARFTERQTPWLRRLMRTAVGRLRPTRP